MPRSNSIIQTQFFPGQGLGNQLWVYAAGRSLAEKYSRRHVVLGLDAFKGHDFLDIDMGLDPDVGASVEQFHEMLYYDASLKYFSSTYDKRVESLHARVQINGLFQSEKYFYGFSNHLGSWIRPNDYVQDLAFEFKDICVLNLRGGEYKRHKSFILPRSYWDMGVKALRARFGAVKIVVVTDDPAYARAFLPEYPVLEGGIADCYAALMGAKAIIVSNSSFSYFPIKTRNDQPFVIAPEHWGRYGHSLRRWAMPANVYKDWVYLSNRGNLRSYAECFEDAMKDADYYEETFNVRVPQHFVVGFSLTRFLPDVLRLGIKRVAAFLLPKHFG